ncbi:MAG: RidA family protein [Elusimicrobiota bacterium]
MKKVISTEKAPKAIGPYSQAIETEDFIFISGQLPINPKTQEMPDEVGKQTKYCLENIKAILNSCGLDLNNIVKTTVYMTDLTKFPIMNEVYATYFNDKPPARATVEVKALPKGAMIEIETIAVKNKV